jgi:hypothetical protein
MPPPTDRTGDGVLAATVGAAPTSDKSPTTPTIKHPSLRCLKTSPFHRLTTTHYCIKAAY